MCLRLLAAVAQPNGATGEPPDRGKVWREARASRRYGRTAYVMPQNHGAASTGGQKVAQAASGGKQTVFCIDNAVRCVVRNGICVMSWTTELSIQMCEEFCQPWLGQEA